MKYTEIIFILDKSGSMSSIKEFAINNFNSFLKEQKELEDDAKMSLILFDSSFKKVADRVDIKKIKELNSETYVPSSMTAMHDCVCHTIEESIDKLGFMSPQDRPEKTICVIITDGMENASKIYSSDDTHYHITEMKEKFNWTFLYVGANQDVIETVDNLGISRSNSMSYSTDSIGISHVYSSISKAVKTYRTEDKKEDLLK